jgi:hypothetical protein
MNNDDAPQSGVPEKVPEISFLPGIHMQWEISKNQLNYEVEIK